MIPLKQETLLTTCTNDYWSYNKTNRIWIRHHVDARKRLFTPCINNKLDGYTNGPNPKTLTNARVTKLSNNVVIKDTWNNEHSHTNLNRGSWKGITMFYEK